MTGSLYLLGDLAQAEAGTARMAKLRERLAVLAFAAVIVTAIVGGSLALGYLVGKLLL